MKLEQQLYTEPRNGDSHVSLNGQWEFGWMDNFPEEIRDLSLQYQTALPRSVYWSLYESGVTPHPYEKCNSAEYRWADQKIWVYRKRFYLSSSQNKGRAIFCADGVSYYCRVWVNDNYLGEHTGMFGGPYADIQSYLNYGGENEIVIAVCAANYSELFPGYKQRSEDNQVIVPWNIVRDDLTSNGDFSVIGPWRSVRIEFLNPLHLARPYLQTESITGGTARIHIQAEIIQPELPEFPSFIDCHCKAYDYTCAYQNGLAEAFRDQKVKLHVSFTCRSTGKVALTHTEEISLLDYQKLQMDLQFYEGNFVNFDVELKDAKLWYPQGLGEQHLYDVHFRLEDSAGQLADELEVAPFGVRIIQWEYAAGKQYRSRWGKFQIVVNGKKFFLKGVNWMPVDFLYLEEEQEYRWTLNMVKQANIQMLRVWSGGGYPESDCFYRLCDELGILVWQDYFIANMDTPNWPQDILQEQVCVNIYRLRNHASLAVHCGGNEFNPYSTGNAASMAVIERNVQDLDPSRAFKRTTSDQGNAHIYRDMEPVWYRHCYRQLPFIGESGIHSFPTAKSLRQLIDPEEYRSTVSDMMGSEFPKTNPQLLNHFTEYVPERIPRMLSRASAILDVSSVDVAQLSEATQMASAEFYQMMIQSMRENYPVTAGMLLWVLKRAWTTVGIQLIDGLGDPILPYYYVKNAYAPINVIVALPWLIYGAGEKVSMPVSVVNESGQSLNGTVKLEVFRDDLTRVFNREYPVSLEADQFLSSIAEEQFVVPDDMREQFFLVRASVYHEEEMLQQSIYWPKCLARMDSEEFRCWMRETPRENIYFDQGPWLKERISSAEKAQVSCDCTQSSFDQENGICHASLTVHNNSDYPAFPVTVQVEEDQTVHLLSDNGFWLAPKETRKIQLEIFDRSGQEREYTLQIASWNSDTVTVSLCS